MKTLKFLNFFTVGIFACLLFFLSGCGFEIDKEIKNNLSDVRYNLFDAKTDNFKINFMSGMREEPYVYDGIHNTLCEFGVLTVIFFDNVEFETLDFLLLDENETGITRHSGVLERNPRNNSFMADIEEIVTDSAILTLQISALGEEKIKLKCTSNDWAVQYNDALSIALSHIQDQAKSYFKNKRFTAETYMKIIYDENANLDEYFWYFGILPQDGESLSIIINTATGEIIS